MSFEWIAENPAYWDDQKQAIIGNAPEGIFDLHNYGAGNVLPGEWWHVEQDGRVIGYGWMDSTWGDAEVLLAVDREQRSRGAGTFILDHLEQEAKSRGLCYLYNVVRPSHPDREGITAWLKKRRFDPSHEEGLLRRRVEQAKDQ